MRRLGIAFLIGLMAGVNLVTTQTTSSATRPVRPTPPTRDPTWQVLSRPRSYLMAPYASGCGRQLYHWPNPQSRSGNVRAQEGVPQGTVFDLTMKSTDSKIYPGIARAPEHLARRS